MPVLKSGGSYKSSQPACSQFCDKLAASAVDTVTAVPRCMLSPRSLQDDPGCIVSDGYVVACGFVYLIDLSICKITQTTIGEILWHFWKGHTFT